MVCPAPPQLPALGAAQATKAFSSLLWPQPKATAPSRGPEQGDGDAAAPRAGHWAWAGELGPASPTSTPSAVLGSRRGLSPALNTGQVLTRFPLSSRAS